MQSFEIYFHTMPSFETFKKSTPREFPLAGSVNKKECGMYNEEQRA